MLYFTVCFSVFYADIRAYIQIYRRFRLSYNINVLSNKLELHATELYLYATYKVPYAWWNTTHIYELHLRATAVASIFEDVPRNKITEQCDKLRNRKCQDYVHVKCEY